MTKSPRPRMLSVLVLLAAGACGSDDKPAVCFSDVDCKALLNVCDLKTHTCVSPSAGGINDAGTQGDGSADAGDGAAANDGALDMGPGRCVGNASCANVNAPFCDLVSGQCLACLQSAHCPEATPICSVDGTCAACNAPAIAATACGLRDPQKAVCGLAGTCLQCQEDTQCASRNAGTNFCVNNRCVACKETSHCTQATTPMCDQNGACVACQGNSQCLAKNAATPFCNLQSGSCQTCLASTDCTDGTKPICDQGICVPCASDGQCAGRDAAAAFCNTDSGVCKACVKSANCSETTKPICINNVCTSCTTDAQCVDKLGVNPGICAYHQDGRCVTEAESLYVEPGNLCSDQGAGSAMAPFCTFPKALAVISESARVIVFRGPNPGAGRITGTFSGSQISVVGQKNALLSTPNLRAVDVRGGDLFLRNVGVVQSDGVYAANGGTLRLDRVTLRNNTPAIWMDAAGFEITNSMVVGNTGNAIRLRTSAGKPQIFRNNTVVNNTSGAAVLCGDAVTLEASLLSNPGESDHSGCTLDAYTTTTADGDPQLTATQRLTPQSLCVDRVPAAQATTFDIEGTARPQGSMADCGAHELPK